MSQRPFNLDAFYRFALGAYLFVLVLAIYPGTNDPTIHIKDLLTAWAAGVLAGSYLLVHWLIGRPLQRPAIFAEIILCLLGFFLISTLFSELFRFSLLETGQFFSLFALYWLATQIYKTPEQVFRLFAVFCAAVFLAGLYAILQKAGLDPFPWADRESDTYTNLPATFGNPNYAAHAIILALIMIACLVRSGRAWAGWLFVPVLLFHLISTEQRAGWIALAGGAVLAGLAWLIMRRSTRRPVFGAISTVLLFAVLGVSVVVGAMYITHARTGSMFPLDLSLLLRYQSYVSATNMLFDAPILGHGPAVYGQAYAAWWTPFEQDWFAQELRVNEHVHNDLLELGIDGGLAAAGLYLVLLVLGIGYALLLVARGPSDGYRRLGYAFAAFFIAFAIDGLFGFNLRVPVTAALFFVMLGVLDGLWSGVPAPATERARPSYRGHACRLAFVLLLFFTTWQETRRFVSEYYFHAASQARTEGDLDRAIEAYEKADQYAGWNWEIPGQMGLVELDRRRPDDALAYFETSLERNPHAFLTHLPASRAHLLHAQAAAAADEPDLEAVRTHLEKARAGALAVLEVAPDFPAANGLLGRIESVAAILDRDYAPDPDPERQREHWRQAREHFQAALDVGARSPGELYRMLMRVESALGNLDVAERALAAALQAAPNRQTWNTFLEFAREHDRFAQFRAAITRRINQLQEAEERTPEDEELLADAYAWLAVVQAEGFNDIDRTGDALARAVALGPGRADLWSRFATFAQKHGRMDALETSILTSFEQLQARNESPLPQVEAVALALRDPAENLTRATQRLLAGVRAHPQPGSVAMMMGYGWAATVVQNIYNTQFEAGTAPCDSALDLGIVAATLGELDLADTLLERAAGCLEGERRAAAAVHRAEALARRGELEPALELLRASEAEFPGHLEIQWAIARTLARGGQIDAARTAYDRLRDNPDLDPEVRAQIERERAQVNAQQP